MERLEGILARPRMWGGAEAIELQFLLLLEILALDVVPEPNEWLMTRYRRFVRGVTSSGAPWLLSGHSFDVDRLVPHLAAFRALFDEETSRLRATP